MQPHHVLIREATPADLPAVRSLLRDYQAWLKVDLGFQQFDHEFATLPGDYAPPAGRLLVGEQGGRVVAVIGLRPLDGPVCEMKRLFVHPSARGAGLGRALVRRLLDEARGIGYREVRLDTLPVMREAQALYEAFGFHDIQPYYDSPVPGTRFMARAL